jgi:serine/threonine-protein kinase HipA
VLSAWPAIGHGRNQLPPEKAKLAMATRGGRPHYRLDEITARHFRELAQRVGLEGLWVRMHALVEAAPVAMERIGAGLPRRFPERVYARIRAGVLSQCRRFVDTAGE